MAREYDDDDDRADDIEDDEEVDDEVREAPRQAKRGGPTDSDKQMAMFCHLGGIIGGFIIPLVIWLTQKDKSRYIDKHGKEALNFQISVAIYAIAAIPLTCGIGTIVVSIMAIVFSIQAGMAASRGESFTYPMTIRFIK